MRKYCIQYTRYGVAATSEKYLSLLKQIDEKPIFGTSAASETEGPQFPVPLKLICFSLNQNNYYKMRIQVGVVVISRAFHLYDPAGSIPRLGTWAEICRSQSDSEGFSPGTPVFLPLQIRLSR